MTTDQAIALERIAAAMERLSPAPPAPIDWLAAPAYVWDREGARTVERIHAPQLDLLRGIIARYAAPPPDLISDGVVTTLPDGSLAARPAHMASSAPESPETPDFPESPEASWPSAA